MDTEDYRTPYGMKLGPAEVVYIGEYRGVRVLTVVGNGQTLEISVSPKGKNLRVWRNGVLLTEGDK